MTHTAEGTRQLAALEKTVRRMMGETNWQAAQDETKTQYAERGIELTPEQVTRETVAAWCAEHLFERGFAQMVVEGDASTGNAILQALDAVRRVVGIKNSPSTGDIASLERLYMQALENRGGTREGDAEYAIEYQNATTNKEILQLIEKVKRGQYLENETVVLKGVEEKTAQKIREITGIDVRGWSVEIEARQIKHILKDHGESGGTDQSMENDNDIARMEYALQNAELIADGGRTTAYFNHVDGKNRPVRTVLYQKQIGDRYYYVVEAVPQTRKKTLQIVGAYINRTKQIEGPHLTDAKSPDATPNNVGVTPSIGTKIAQNAPGVNPHSMQNGKNYSKGAYLPPERMTGDALIDPSGERGNGETPSGVGDATSLGEGGYAPAVDEAAVLETALRSQVQGRAESQVRLRNKDDDVGAALDELARDLGEEELLRRMYNAAQIRRPTGTVEIDGQWVDANAYIDAYEQALPEDPAALEQTIRRLERERDAEIARMAKEGALEDYSFGGLKIDLQLFAAQRKWELPPLDAGEEGSKTRQFYEKRLRGTDANHHQELVDLLAGRDETYNPIADKKTLDRADKKLMDGKYQDRLIRRLMRYDTHDQFNAVEVAAAQVLINNALNDGEWQVAMNLITGLSRKGTELGRAVQAFSMMARLTPEGTLRAAQRTIKAEADYVIGEGASDGLDMLADDIAGALGRLARLKGIDGDDKDVNSGYPSIETAEERLDRKQIQEIQQLTAGVRTSFYDLTEEQIKKLDSLETRLYRELKEKSPFIRRRFGEWRIRDNTPVQIATQEGSARGVLKNEDTGWNIQVSGKVFNENTNHHGPSATTARPYMSYINDIVRRAVLLDTCTLDEAKSENSLCMHSLYALADIGDGLQLLKLYVEEMYNPSQRGTARRAYQLLNIESQPTGAKGSQQKTASPVSLSADSVSIADLIKLVKKKDAAYKPKAPEDVLSEDLAATEGNYLSKEQIKASLQKVITDSTKVPEQVKRYVLKKIRKNDGALADRIYEIYRKGDLSQVKLRRAMEEALELPTLTDGDVQTLVEMATKAQSLSEDPVAQADAMDEIYDFLGAKMSVNWLDRLQAWRKFGMLANVKTHLRNIDSNAAYVGIRKADDLVAMGLERLFLKDPQKRTAQLGWSHTEHGRKILPELQKRAEEAVLEMQHRGAKYETGTGQLKTRRKFFGESKFGEWLNSLNSKNSDLLEREDIKFFKPAYIDALGQIMTARGATEITEEMHAMAMKRALEATFRADNAISEVISSLKRYQNESKAGSRLFGQAVDVVIPFHKTPANIAIQTALHSPLGIAKGALDLYNATKGKGSKDAAAAINTMAKGVTGTALLAIGLLLGSAGLFNTGFGKTEKERAADELAGRQENALMLGDVSVSLDWLQPAASPLIVGASMGQRLAEDDISLSSVFGAVMDGTDSLFEMTMLQSLYDILGGYDAGASATAASVVENVVSQSIPTVFGQAARAIDPVQRKTTGDSDFETLVNQVRAKIPGLTYLLDPELDVWGEEVYRTGKIVVDNRRRIVDIHFKCGVIITETI